jgi:hypothetical protein
VLQRILNDGVHAIRSHSFIFKWVTAQQAANRHALSAVAARQY